MKHIQVIIHNQNAINYEMPCAPYTVRVFGRAIIKRTKTRRNTPMTYSFFMNTHTTQGAVIKALARLKKQGITLGPVSKIITRYNGHTTEHVYFNLHNTLWEW